jgi:hypothetical protein
MPDAMRRCVTMMDTNEAAAFEVLAEQGRQHTSGMREAALEIHRMLESGPLSDEETAYARGLIVVYRMLRGLPATQAGFRAAAEHAWAWVEQETVVR